MDLLRTLPTNKYFSQPDSIGVSGLPLFTCAARLDLNAVLNYALTFQCCLLCLSCASLCYLNYTYCLWDRFCLKESTHVCFKFVAEKFEMSSTQSVSYVLRIGVTVIEVHDTNFLVSHTFKQKRYFSKIACTGIFLNCSNNPIYSTCTCSSLYYYCDNVMHIHVILYLYCTCTFL